MTTLKAVMKASLKRAHRVLGLVSLDALTKNERGEVMVEAYENCREQGYAVVVHGFPTAESAKLKASFAECRNSDQMVVYVGKPMDFSTGNIPNEQVYRGAAHYFSSEEEAAAFIQKLVVKAAREARAALDKALADKEAT